MKSKLFVIVTQRASALNPSHEQGGSSNTRGAGCGDGDKDSETNSTLCRVVGPVLGQSP